MLSTLRSSARPAGALLRTSVQCSRSASNKVTSSTPSEGQDTPDLPLARVAFKKKSVWQAQTEQGPTAESVAVSGGPSPDKVAMPRTAHGVPTYQSRNYPELWSTNQNPRENAMRGPRFEQTIYELQPMPQSAMQLISEEPIRLVEDRIASCDGGGGSLGHPKIFINLDKPGPKACGYSGIRFERAVQEHHHH
ncbi:hypothetical protein P389DRAFT_165688 [Cystobasidium minutum MCA 4210]|uniref:uncharacterized protein n=1 Tax=Cystobasidium minutum MCA 4210 TaxID=1397322 RepID=UPI0034CEA3F6|eukprot:jgi/Rhomi1/165688/fgenesh1_kg.1_\